jgi:hypothetical protein
VKHTRPHHRFEVRLFFSVLGSLVLATGLLMLVLPGPGLLVSVLGLALLSRAHHWPRRVIGRAHDLLERTQDSAQASWPVTVLWLGLSSAGIALGVLALLAPVPGSTMAGVSLLVGSGVSLVGALLSRAGLRLPRPE